MGKQVKFRKWKVKDKNKIILANGDRNIIKNGLVYDCLEKNMVLDEEEYKYMLFQIRNISLHNPIEYNFKCSACKTQFNYILNLDDCKPRFEKYGIIKSNNHEFIMQRIKNQEIYDESMSQSDDVTKPLLDFIFHCTSYNGNDALSFEELNNIINDLDVEDFEEIMDKWNKMRFRVDNVLDVECPHCNNSELYEFDAMPGFFPPSWEI